MAAVLLSVIASLIGTYIVSRRLVFLSGGITHASFGGIGIAYYLGIDPILGAAVFAVLSALGLETLTKKRRMREDSAIGVLWAFGMAVGVFFVFLTPGYAPNLMSYLFGNILTISTIDLIQLASLDTILLAFFGLLYRPILNIAFDENYAQIQNKATNIITIILKVLVALALVFSIRAIGIILLIALLTIPANIANLFYKRFGQIIWLSGSISLVAIVAGIALSYRLNVPSGAAVVMVLAMLYLMAKCIIFVSKKIQKI